MEFADRECLGDLLVLLLTHPVRPHGLAPNDEVITDPEALASAKVGAAFARPVLLEQAIDTAALQLAKQEVGWKEGIAEQNVAVRAPIEQATQQRLLVAAFALTGAGGRIEQGAASQTEQPHHAAQRKA
jgi:hypothetical protein